MKEITLKVEVNGSEVERTFVLDQWEEKDPVDWGAIVLDMLDTIEKADKI